MFTTGILLSLVLGAVARHVADAKYYDLLGVPVTASDSDLRKAYHKLALKWHPDKHSQKSDVSRKVAEDKFKEISLAYDTLSDPEKRKTYDQVGEEGMKHGGKGSHKFQTGGFDPFKLFEDVFKGFSGGGGFAFNIRMGGGGGGPQGLFADHAEDVETMQEQDKLQRIIEAASSEVDAASKQFLAVLCIESNKLCKKLKSGLVKLARTHKGGVSFYAVDCMHSPMLCRLVEADVKVYPCLVYFGYGRRLPYGADSEGAIPSPEAAPTLHGIRTWLARVIPDAVVHINSVSDQERFLSSLPGKVKVVLLTDKPSTPPRLKALSMELREHLGIAILSKRSVPDVFAHFAAAELGHKMPEALPVLYNVQTKELIDKGGEDMRSYLTTLVEEFRAQHASQHQALLEELTLDMHTDGVCGVSDNKFCLLVVFWTEGSVAESEQIKGAFSTVMEEFKRESEDPLRVFFVCADKIFLAQHMSSSSRLGNLLSAAGFADGASLGALLWRPKWSRFEEFTGNLSTAEEALAFVRSAFVRVALHGEVGLSHVHQAL
mmetsp:Transcript_7658/g.16027  ORF Transcript_7658/g.16027 Transcript_7658/m.16027 type:complete len:546 (+) Transcript_7658:73-1710(+)